MKTFSHQDLETIDIQIGARLRRARKTRGVTQTQLGEAIGVTFQQVQKYERGVNRVSSSAAVALCAVLKISYEDLLGPVDFKPDSLPPEPALRLGDDHWGERLAASWSALDTDDKRTLTLLAEKIGGKLAEAA